MELSTALGGDWSEQLGLKVKLKCQELKCLQWREEELLNRKKSEASLLAIAHNFSV